MKPKCIIWGTGYEYERYINHIVFEAYKGNLEILGVTSNETALFSLDKFSFIHKSLLSNYEFDYIILACSQSTSVEILKEADSMNIPREKLLRANIFQLPGFDFGLYINLYESHISIISNHCWGGLIYHRLGMPFNSPFINLYLDDLDYLKLLRHFDDYMNEELTLVKNGSGYGWPVGRLYDIDIQFIHYTFFEEAKKIWDIRKKRINRENLFVEMTVSESVDYVKEFDSMPFENKICFFHDKADFLSCYQFKEFNDPKLRKRFNSKFKEYICSTAIEKTTTSTAYNILKLLLGMPDFSRKEYVHNV